MNVQHWAIKTIGLSLTVCVAQCCILIALKRMFKKMHNSQQK